MLLFAGHKVIIFLLFGYSWQTVVLIACYIYLFLVIGVDIMKKNMTKEEIEESEKKRLEKKNKKKGAINVDIIIAIIVFGVFFASTIFIKRNYIMVLNEYELKTNALNLCINKLNESKSLNIESLTSNTGTSEIDGTSYNWGIEVLPYVKNGNETVENAKIIISTVTYMMGTEEQTISFKTIKVENEE